MFTNSLFRDEAGAIAPVRGRPASDNLLHPVDALAFDTRPETVFSLLRRPEAAPPRSQWLWLAVLTASAWFGAVAFIGTFRQRPSPATQDRSRW